MLPARLIVSLLSMLLLAGCAGDRYRVVRGPARLTVGATAVTPEIAVELEAGGRAFFGPDFDGFYEYERETADPP